MKKDTKTIRPEIERRAFLKNCSKTLPSLLFLVASFDVQELIAKENGTYDPTEHNYAMGVNIKKCIGCARCADACKNENKVPREPHFFRTWVERYVIPEEGEPIVESPNGGIDGYPEIQKDLHVERTFFVPKLCNHCVNAPCVQVCPVGATFATEDGVVLVDPKWCVGCRYCIQACPYGARYLHPETNVADKCTFCYHRITDDKLPACVEVCPTQTRIFGERGKKSSPLRRFFKFNEIHTLKPGLNTKPKVYYAGLDGEVI